VRDGGYGAAGVDRRTPVSVSVRDVPYRKVLTTVLAVASADVGFSVEEGMKFAGDFPIPQGGSQGFAVSPPTGSKAVRNLVLIVRPEIIVHREVENDLFGEGYDRPTGAVPGTGSAGLP
jgi:hypothetical protein